MYEALSAPIPDFGLYLKRIAYHGPLDHTREVLSGLVYAHQTSVPFENYDICELGRPISLETLHLYDKIVLHRRGGYCFELNASFASLLTALGFEVWPVLARLFRAPNGEEPTPPSHRVNLVCLGDQKMFLDVGFGGPMPSGALILEGNTRQEIRGFRYFFEKRPRNQWILYRESSGKAVEPMLGFAETPSEAVDFITPNYYTSTHPDSLFVRGRIANIRFEDGLASIGNGQFHLVRGGNDTTCPIESKEQETALLQEYFGITLPCTPSG